MESKDGFTKERECDSFVCASVTAIFSEKFSERNKDYNNYWNCLIKSSMMHSLFESKSLHGSIFDLNMFGTYILP